MSGEYTLRYDADLDALPFSLAQRFVPLEHDLAAQAFVRDSLLAPHGRLVTGLYTRLRRWMSDYDAYGLLGMYPMHLLSQAQFRQLLAGARKGQLLDVGAGSGAVTAQAAGDFDAVTVTESSRIMRRKLRARGFAVLAHDLARSPLPDERRFDAVLCLNVLDRCSHPRSLLSHLQAALPAHGRLLLSVPLPLSPHVHVGATTLDPDEPLPSSAGSWEQDAAQVASELLLPSGLHVERLSRVPYLCRGDAHRSLYVLDAAIFLCRSQPDP